MATQTIDRKNAVRLSNEQVQKLKSTVRALDPNAKVLLFGSRTNTSARGGDIDIAIISTLIKRRDLYKIRWPFFETFGEQKLDIIIDDGSGQTPFAKLVLPQAVML